MLGKGGVSKCLSFLKQVLIFSWECPTVSVQGVPGLADKHSFLYMGVSLRWPHGQKDFFVQLGNRIATHFRNASDFETNSSQMKCVTSCMWLTKVTEALTGVNPVRIGGSVAELHLHERPSF